MTEQEQMQSLLNNRGSLLNSLHSYIYVDRLTDHDKTSMDALRRRIDELSTQIGQLNRAMADPEELRFADEVYRRVVARERKKRADRLASMPKLSEAVFAIREHFGRRNVSKE